MKNEALKLSFIGSHTAEYLQWKYQHNATSPWKNATEGVYVGTHFVTDFLTRRWCYNVKRIFTDPFNIGFVIGVGILTSKSAAPKDVASSVMGEALLMTVGFFLLFGIPLLSIALTIDLFVLLPYLLLVRHQYVANFKQQEREYVKTGKPSTLFLEESNKTALPAMLQLTDAIKYAPTYFK